MINQIKKHLKKYHEADLWLEQAYMREEKKQALEAVTEPQTGIEPPSVSAAIQPHVVFTYYDAGHNQDEKNKIQQLYSELGSMLQPTGLAM